jgi:hypothetical protein
MGTPAGLYTAEDLIRLFDARAHIYLPTRFFDLLNDRPRRSGFAKRRRRDPESHVFKCRLPFSQLDFPRFHHIEKER